MTTGGAAAQSNSTPPSSRAAAETPTKGLFLKDVCVSFRGKRVIENVNLTVAPGEVVGFVGGSGVGKTTVLNLIAGLLPPTSGLVTVDGRAPTARRDGATVGYLFQQPTLLPWLKVIDYVALPLLVRDRGSALFNPFGQLTEPERAKVRAALAQAKVTEIEQARPAELSGGMQTRVALARTIVADPTLLMLDEPFNSLDEVLRAEIYGEIQTIIAQRNATTLVVTHNILEAVLLCDRVILLARPSLDIGANVAAEVRVTLPRPRSMNSVDTPEFLGAVKSVREALFGR